MKKIGIDIGHNVAYDGGALGFRDENELKENGASHIAKTPNDIYEIIKTLEV